MLLILSGGIMLDAIRRYFEGSEPVGVILACFIVIWTGSNLLVEIAVACFALYGGIDILRDAHMDVHEERGTQHGD